MKKNDIILTNEASGNCKVVLMDGSVEVFFPKSDLDEIIDEVMTSSSFYNWQFTAFEGKSWVDFATLEINVRSMLIAYGDFEERIIADEEGGLFKRINDFIKSGAIRLALSAVKFNFPKDTLFLDNIDSKLYEHLISRFEQGHFLNGKIENRNRLIDASNRVLSIN